MANIVIDVAAEFTGKKAFDQADKSTFNLEKSVKKLAKTFGLAFGTTAVVNFSKKAVQAFAEDEAAAVRLTRAVENLGIGFSNPAISKFIADLERSAAIADDILRPAFQGLLTTTGSLTQSQKLLNDAITISRASGIDLATVSQDLANGYVGITRGLKKYNTGLTTAELTTKSFSEVLGVLLTRSAGAATDYLDTTQYKMDALTIATGNASEIIGGGLVNAFARIGGGTEASDAAKAIEDIATAVAFTTETIGSLIGVIPSLLSTLKNIPKNLVEGFAGSAAGRNLTPKPLVTKTPTQITQQQQAKLLAKLEADAIKRQKALLALQKKQLDATKKAAAEKAKLDKAASVFDLQKIQIAAALKGKISEEEKTRLLLMQAIADEDTVKAEALQKKLEDIQKQNAKIAADLLAIGQAKDPFATWAGSLALAVAQLSKLNSGITMIPGVTYNPAQSKDRNYDDALAAAAAAKAAADKAAADKAAAEAAAILGGASEKAAAEKAAADAAAAKLAKDAADKAAAAALGGAGITFNEKQNPDRNYDTKAAADAAAAAAVAVTNGSPVAGVNFNPSQSRDRNYDSGFGTQAPVTVNVTNTGSVIMQDEFVKVINDAVTVGLGQGLKIKPPGSLPDFE
jgi:hypothetical protein